MLGFLLRVTIGVAIRTPSRITTRMAIVVVHNATVSVPIRYCQSSEVCRVGSAAWVNVHDRDGIEYDHFATQLEVCENILSEVQGALHL